MNDLPEVTDIRKVSLTPDDVLVVTVDGRLTREQQERITGNIKRVFGEDARVAVLCGGLTLEVVTQSQEVV